MRLLLADDEREIAKAVRTVLEHNRYTVDTVDNGADALEYEKTGAYAGIILDIMMPGQDGLSVLRELREGGVETPVLLLTALGELDDRVAGLEADIADGLTLSGDESAIQTAFATLLENAAQRPDGETILFTVRLPV